MKEYTVYKLYTACRGGFGVARFCLLAGARWLALAALPVSQTVIETAARCQARVFVGLFACFRLVGARCQVPASGRLAGSVSHERQPGALCDVASPQALYGALRGANAGFVFLLSKSGDSER